MRHDELGVGFDAMSGAEQAEVAGGDEELMRDIFREVGMWHAALNHYSSRSFMGVMHFLEGYHRRDGSIFQDVK